MGRGVKIPWLVVNIREVKIRWIRVQNTMEKGFDISWVGGYNTMNRASEYHGWRGQNTMDWGST
jgi:hypothetical protein